MQIYNKCSIYSLFISHRLYDVQKNVTQIVICFLINQLVCYIFTGYECSYNAAVDTIRQYTAHTTNKLLKNNFK